MRLVCLHCGREFTGSISKDNLGWHSLCPICNGSFDVDIPDGRIVMAFGEYTPNPRFSDEVFETNSIISYYAFDTEEAFIQKWATLVHNPDGPWYWVLNADYSCICSGACDPSDIDIFCDAFENANLRHIYEEYEVRY